MSAARALVFGCIFLGVLGSCLSLQCYECSGTNAVGWTSTVNCNDQFKADGIPTKTCASGEVCKKESSSTLGLASTATRSCSSSCSDANLDILGVKTATKCCSTDLCNSSYGLTYNFMVVMAMVSVAMAMWKL